MFKWSNFIYTYKIELGVKKLYSSVQILNFFTVVQFR